MATSEMWASLSNHDVDGFSLSIPRKPIMLHHNTQLLDCGDGWRLSEDGDCCFTKVVYHDSSNIVGVS